MATKTYSVEEAVSTLLAISRAQDSMGRIFPYTHGGQTLEEFASNIRREPRRWLISSANILDAYSKNPSILEKKRKLYKKAFDVLMRTGYGQDQPELQTNRRLLKEHRAMLASYRSNPVPPWTKVFA